MLFIVFDIEIVFLYPLAVILHELAWFGFVELLFFVAILALGYVYIWPEGSAGVAVEKPLADLGLRSERVCSGRARGRACSSRRSPTSSSGSA